MNIKHWQGYGRVKATKLALTTRETTFNEYSEWGCKKIKQLSIKVEGNHEWGIETTDVYDIFNWLVKRFDKSVSDYTKIKALRLETSYNYEEHCDMCIYHLTIAV